MWELLGELFPICRSITGAGVRRTLDILGRCLPLELHCFSSGTECFDWEVPLEWNIQNAYLKDESGNTIVDFAENNLHVVNYSLPVEGWFAKDELKHHLFSLPEQPDVIPYITSYYGPTWGFCLRHRDLDRLRDGRYFARIESSLRPGELILGEAFLPGLTQQEILISTYICHPSMANDSLSGVVLAVELYRRLRAQPHRFGYRFLFVPETIGAIAYLSRFGDRLRHTIHAGLVVTCVGDSGPFHYKQTRRGNHVLDRVVENVLSFSNVPHEVRSFWPLGSDERQYCSPGFNLPVGSLMRSVYGEFPEYHTSADNLEFISPQALQESLEIYRRVLMALEQNVVYRRTVPYGEPQLGRRNLYPTLGTKQKRTAELRRMMWVLNLADGHNSVIDMAERMDDSVIDIVDTARRLVQAELLQELPETEAP
ncbi:MAG: DUF4910 domain-containing protein [Acidobacteria bacterium]|nr:DUF4910 domain-containing protein [Acidobacteriota bacterium]